MRIAALVSPAALISVAAAVTAQAAAPSAPPPAFAGCAGCQPVARGESHGVVPNLFGIVGARAGTHPGFVYSRALGESGLIWTRANLLRFIRDSQAAVPGKRMNVVAPPHRAAQEAIVAWLATLD